MTQNLTIETFSEADMLANLDTLGGLIHACVNGGASISYVLPYSQEDAKAFWRDKVQVPLRCQRLVLLVARMDGAIAGSVQLDHDTPPNQPHRAEVRKLMVHPRFRRQGVARALMIALEAQARRLGRSLLTLDTRTGDNGEPLYASLGYKVAGVIPEYCIDTIEQTRFDGTTYMYKAIAPHRNEVAA